MADLKISQLTGATTPLAGTEVLPIVQSGSTVKVSINDLTAGRATSMAGASITGAGTSIDFSGTTQRFTANTTGATVNDRFAFVTNQANSTTRFNAAPNGTGTACSLNAFNNSNLNNASVAALIASSTAVTLSSGITGTGTYLPLYITTSGANRIEVSTAGDVTINAGDLIQSTAGKGIKFSGDNNILWRCGTGTPEGAVTAPVGSLFTRTDGGANTTLYVKESGTGNTGWVAK